MKAYGRALFEALRSGTTIQPLTESEPGITVDDAYRISQHFLQCRLSDGEALVGKKIGVTSKPVQDMLGVFQPDFGFLTDAMEYTDTAEIPIEGHLIQPRAEGEIAFRLQRDLKGPGITEADVLAATATIMPCFEIVDSRIDDWRIKIQDTVADNASCGAYLFGADEVDPRDFDLPALKMRIFKNSDLIAEGEGSAVQGNPLTAVAWLANTLGEYGIPFKAGEVILSGSLGPLIPVVAGDEMSLTLEGVGGCSCRFV
ncbi:MAG: fumarylacetoacetate hydrolase family protein [Pseudomonadota bacterium]